MARSSSATPPAPSIRSARGHVECLYVVPSWRPFVIDAVAAGALDAAAARAFSSAWRSASPR